MIILVLYVPAISYESLLIILFGFFNSAQAIVFAVSREISPAKAVTNMFIMISGIIQPVSGYLLETISSKSNTVNAVAQYSATAYEAALSIVPIGLLITVCLSFLLKESYSENTDSHYK